MASRAARPGVPVALALSLVCLLLTAAQPAAAAEPAGYAYFHTYAENEAIIDNVVAAHPGIAQKFSIGRSYEGRQIWGIKLTQNVNGGANGKPAVFINGLMHARERASNELALYMLQVLGNNYGLSGGERVYDKIEHVVAGRRGVRHVRRQVAQVAQEPPAHPRFELDRHRSQSSVRLHLELLPGRREQQAFERLLPGSVGLLHARGSGLPRLRQ